MEINLVTQALGTSETFFESSAEQPVDCDINLPDYCRDIQRVLKCSVTPHINGVGISGERVSADGSSIIRIIYVSDSGKLKCFEQTAPINCSVDINGLGDNSCIDVKARTDYANCRAISPRRAEVHGMVRVVFKAKRTGEQSILTSAEGGGVQLKNEKVSALSFTGELRRTFPLSEVVETGAKPPVSQIVRVNASAVTDEVKTISGKLLIKGSLDIGILYYSDDDSGELISFSHSMPISQIVEMPGVTDESVCETALRVSSVDVQPKADGGGAMKLLDMEAKVTVCARCGVMTEFPVVADAYSTLCPTRLDTKNTEFVSFSESFNDSFLCKGGIDFSGTGISSVLDISCSDVVCGASVNGDELLVTGTATVELIYNDKESRLNYAERQIDFEYKRMLKEKMGDVSCTPDIQIGACSCSVSSDNRAEVKTELLISAYVYSVEAKKIVISIETDEGASDGVNDASLTVYFADEGEKLWDIARRYNTTLEAIISENDLDGDTAVAGPLLIPRVTG